MSKDQKDKEIDKENDKENDRNGINIQDNKINFNVKIIENYKTKKLTIEIKKCTSEIKTII